MNIPDKYKDVAREIAAVCMKHNLSYCNGTFQPHHNDPFRDAIEFEFRGQGHAPAFMRIKTEIREDVVLP